MTITVVIQIPEGLKFRDRRSGSSLKFRRRTGLQFLPDLMDRRVVVGLLAGPQLHHVDQTTAGIPVNLADFRYHSHRGFGNALNSGRPRR